MSWLGFVVSLAWRDSRASWHRLLLLAATVMAGVGALVAINSFTDNIRVSVAEQAQALLGGDLALRSRASVDTASVATALLDSLANVGGDSVRTARSASFVAMAYLPSGGSARLVQVRTVDPGWPYHGSIATRPAGVWEQLQSGAMLVDPSLLTALGAEVGDTLVLGESRFPVAGTVTNVPGETGIEAAFGTRVFIAHSRLPETRLLGFGARVEHTTYLALPRSIDAQDVAEAWRDTLRTARVSIRTVADDRDDMTRDLTNLGRFLGMVALAALLLGGLGTASAVHVLIRQRLDSIAVLRCLGATSGQLIAAHLLQAVTMALLGSLVGAGLGVMLQQLLPRVLADFLPVDVRVTASVGAMLLGVGLGVWTAAAFALLPLLGIRSVAPLATLRRNTDPPRMRWDAPRVVVAGALALSVLGLAIAQGGSWRMGRNFTLGIAVALLVLWLTSMLLIRVTRRITPTISPYLVRQGLSNLHRPGNQTVTVVLALGFGAFLLTTLFAAQSNLLRGLRIDAGPARPNMVLIDIQRDQRELVGDVVRSGGGSLQPPVAMVQMRIAAVNGQEVGRIIGTGRIERTDTVTSDGDDALDGLWAWRREYRSTYRDSLASSETITAGRWFTGSDRGSGRSMDDPVGISVEKDVAGELRLRIGDTVTWNVQGAMIHSVVRSFREVNWARFEPNFFVVFAPGALEAAPQTAVALTRVEDREAMGRIQRSLAEQAPNVTSVDLGELQRTLEQVLGRIVAAIRFMAIFSLATGAVVLVGAMATSRWQRIREGTLLRTLGATGRQVLVVLSVEYVALGLAAALVAVLLAGAAGWALARFVFSTSFVWPVFPMILLALGLVALTTITGLWSSLDLMRRPPLEVLRDEA